MKKLLCIALSLMMILSTTAFAAETKNAELLDNGTYGATVDFTGSLNVPTITVTIPAAGTVFVNPYKLEAELNTNDTPDSTQDGIFSIIYGIESKTNVDLDIGVYGTVTPGGDVVVKGEALTEGTADAPTAKEVFVFLYVDDESSTATKLDDDKGYTIADAPADPTAENSGALILTEDTDEVPVVLGTLPAFTDDGDDGEFTEGDDTVGVATFRFSGASQPYTTEPWNSNDTVTASVIFNFVPAVAEVTP